MVRLTGDLLDAAATTYGRLGPHGILYENAEVPARDGVTQTKNTLRQASPLFSAGALWPALRPIPLRAC